MNTNMHTIVVKTKSTTKFTWTASGARGIGQREATGLVVAVVDAIDDFRKAMQSRTDVKACLVTWQDGDDLHAFLYRLSDDIPMELPWILMQTQPQDVTREVRE